MKPTLSLGLELEVPWQQNECFARAYQAKLQPLLLVRIHRLFAVTGYTLALTVETGVPGSPISVAHEAICRFALHPQVPAASNWKDVSASAPAT